MIFFYIRKTPTLSACQISVKSPCCGFYTVVEQTITKGESKTEDGAVTVLRQFYEIDSAHTQHLLHGLFVLGVVPTSVLLPEVSLFSSGCFIFPS